MSGAHPLAERLPLRQVALLRAAIGQTVLEVERWLSTTPLDFAARGGDASDHFSRASGATQLTFSGGLVHSLSTWPSELSVTVEDPPFGSDPYADRYSLSETSAAPDWLQGCIGRAVRDVRIYIYRDDVPSEEARQAAVSYLFDAHTELCYCTHVHGRMSGDELLRSNEVLRDHCARCISLGQGHVPS